MIDVLIYLLKCSCSTALFYVLYIALIKKNHYAEFKRFYLLFILVFSFVVPLIDVSALESVGMPNLVDSFVTSAAVDDGYTLISSQVEVADQFSWSSVLIGIYLLCLVGFVVRILIGVVSIIKISQTAESVYINDKKVSITKLAQPAFSFFRRMYVSKEAFDNKIQLPIIVEHEQAHIDQWHSVDILISQIQLAILWFNPFSYLIKKEMELNVETLADKKVCSFFDAKSYIETLLLYKINNNNRLVVAPQFVRHPVKERVKEIVINQKNPKRKSHLRSLIYLIPSMMIILLSLGGVAVETQAFVGIPEVAGESCDCDHIHMAPGNKMIIIEEGPYGPVQRVVD